MIEVDHADKLLQLFDSGWNWELFDCKHFRRERSNAIAGHPVAKEIDFSNTEKTLLDFDDQAVIYQKVAEGVPCVPLQTH